MIKYTTGNLMASDAEAIVNAVNTVGVMGNRILTFTKPCGIGIGLVFYF